MKNRILKNCYIAIALVFSASALFFYCGNGKDMHICADEYVQTCAHTQFGAEMSKELIIKLGKLYSFTTRYDADNADRSENIRLAAEKLNGCVVPAGGIFSFNRTVGARTEANGFKKAKIIQDGKFVPGTGGGVCQVSTTLYNAALLSGMEIREFHQHSLQVYYVAPSRDAMVSGTYFDFKFRNNRATPVCIGAEAADGAVTCTIYGESDGYKYYFESEVFEVVPRPQAVVVEGEEDKTLCCGREGLKSGGYLIKLKNGVRTRTLIRRDSYQAVADIIQVKKPLPQ